MLEKVRVECYTPFSSLKWWSHGKHPRSKSQVWWVHDYSGRSYKAVVEGEHGEDANVERKRAGEKKH